MKEFNINSHVKVRLTDEGVRILEENYNNLLRKSRPGIEKIIGPFKAPTVDEDGYTDFQFHDLMRTFGEYMFIGNMNMPFDTDIRFEDEDLIDVKEKTKKRTR